MEFTNILRCNVCNSTIKVTKTLTIACCVHCRNFFRENMKKRLKWKPCKSNCDACCFCRLKKCLKIGLKYSERGRGGKYIPSSFTDDEIEEILINGNVEIAKVSENRTRGPCSVCHKQRAVDSMEAYRSNGACNSCYVFYRHYRDRKRPVCEVNIRRFQRCLDVGLGQRRYLVVNGGKLRKKQKLEEEVPAELFQHLRKPQIKSEYLTDKLHEAESDEELTSPAEEEVPVKFYNHLHQPQINDCHVVLEQIPSKIPRFTSSIVSSDSSSGEESEQNIEVESEFKRRRLSIAAVIAEKEHKLMVSN